ncbi:MAG: hypothetical protein IPF59_00020 [Ignavibacteria bacterium]|nr:hypothetical protein [Ignavibacteria bacterium]MBK6418537.1 hypothetical protein [Ignavibacteria bacterium]MBK7411536.1 hypothetical protein [Ignavibacteria bacterium]
MNKELTGQRTASSQCKNQLDDRYDCMKSRLSFCLLEIPSDSSIMFRAATITG